MKVLPSLLQYYDEKEVIVNRFIPFSFSRDYFFGDGTETLSGIIKTPSSYAVVSNLFKKPLKILFPDVEEKPYFMMHTDRGNVKIKYKDVLTILDPERENKAVYSASY